MSKFIPKFFLKHSQDNNNTIKVKFTILMLIRIAEFGFDFCFTWFSSYLFFYQIHTVHLIVE